MGTTIRNIYIYVIYIYIFMYILRYKSKSAYTYIAYTLYIYIAPGCDWKVTFTRPLLGNVAFDNPVTNLFPNLEHSYIYITF